MLEHDATTILLYAQAWEYICQRRKRAAAAGQAVDYATLVEEVLIQFGDPTGTPASELGVITAPATVRQLKLADDPRWWSHS